MALSGPRILPAPNPHYPDDSILPGVNSYGDLTTSQKQNLTVAQLAELAWRFSDADQRALAVSCPAAVAKGAEVYWRADAADVLDIIPGPRERHAPARVETVLALAWSAVQDEAPNAPLDVRNEAVLRYASYLLTAEPTDVTDESTDRREAGSSTEGGSSEYSTSRTVKRRANSAAAFVHSGAKALLQRHKRRFAV